MSWFKILKAQRYYDPDAPGEIDELPEEQEVPPPDAPVVNPQNLNQYLEPEEDQDIQQEPPPGFEEQESFLDEIPDYFEDELSIIERAIDENQCIAFEYTSINSGKFLGWRLLEVYNLWQASTGNTLLIGWDRHRNDIRCFGIDGITANTLKIMPGDFYSYVKNKFVFNPQY